MYSTVGIPRLQTGEDVKHLWLQAQKDLPFRKEDHMAAFQDVYRRFPNSKELAKAASFIERAGSKL